MTIQYPVLERDVFFGKVKTPSGFTLHLYNTTTQKEFNPNPATAALLELCTGHHTIPEIIAQLSRQSGEPADTLTGPVHNILDVLQQKQIITMATTPENNPIKIITTKYPIKTAQIEITNRCNLSCVHCANNSGAPYPEELTTEQICAAIDALSVMGVTTLTISGGEPFLHPDVLTIIEHARNAPMSVSIFTNGTVLTEDIIKQCASLTVNTFIVSIDSMDFHIHDTFRRQKGALKKTLKSIQLLKKAQFPIVIAVSVSNMNKNGGLPIYKYGKTVGVTGFQIMPVRFSGRGIPGVAITPQEYYHFLREHFMYVTTQFPEAIPAVYPKVKEQCSIGRDTIGIKPTGVIVPCPSCTTDMGIGNVKEGLECWDTHEYVETIRSMRAEDDTTCGQCEYLPYCGGCIACGYLVKGVLQCYDPYRCPFYKAYGEIVGFSSGC